MPEDGGSYGYGIYCARALALFLVKPKKRVSTVEDAANLPKMPFNTFKRPMHVDTTLYAITNTNTINSAGLKMAWGVVAEINFSPSSPPRDNRRLMSPKKLPK